jgi:hypothetical protein
LILVFSNPNSKLQKFNPAVAYFHASTNLNELISSKEFETLRHRQRQVPPMPQNGFSSSPTAAQNKLECPSLASKGSFTLCGKTL